MDKKQNSRIKKGIKTINSQLDLISNELIYLYVATDSDDIVSVNEHLKELYNRLQKCCLYARKFASNEVMNQIDIEQMLDADIENSGIEIVKFDNDVIKISMPIITPFAIYKRVMLYPNNELTPREIDAIDRSEFMIETLKTAIIKFIKCNEINHIAYKKSTLLYIHYFKNNYPMRRIPDTDNYSYKAFNDLITGYLAGYGDNALETDFFIKTAHGKETHTEIYLIPKQFNSFIKKIISPKAVYSKTT